MLSARDVITDDPHRTLADTMLRSAIARAGVEVDNVAFGGKFDGDAEYAWLCYLADPAAPTRRTDLTEKSADDHLRRYDPNGLIARHAGHRVQIRAFELETSDQASFVLLNDDGSDRLFSPWQQHLVVVRVTFHYDVL